MIMMMRLFRILGRNIRDAVRSVFRNFSLSIASISCIAITLVIVALSITSSYNVDNFTKLMKEGFTIVVFLENNVTEEEVSLLKAKIKGIENVASYEFENKKEIADSMMESSDVFKNIMSGWDETENPLQDTFLVKVEDTEKISETAKELKELEGVSLVKYGEGIVERLLSAFKAVEKGLIIIVFLLVFVTAFLITNTIKLTIFSRKKEIEIMRLVGASNINIELSFIIEGLLLGFLGALLPIILVIYGYNSLYLNFEGQLFSPFVRLVSPYPFMYLVALILLALGVIVGMIGSFNAVRKYLKI
jgi:cell division transport system permease protein